jgi:hypothetical protein
METANLMNASDLSVLLTNTKLAMNKIYQTCTSGTTLW